MSWRRRLAVIAVWLITLGVAASWGQLQGPGRSDPEGDHGTVISGGNVGFRVDRWKGGTPAGALVVRIDGRWVEAVLDPDGAGFFSAK